jgi:hypothetical protein
MTHQKSESPKAQRTTAEALGNSISFLITVFLFSGCFALSLIGITPDKEAQEREAKLKANLAILDGENGFAKRQAVLELTEGCESSSSSSSSLSLSLSDGECHSLAGSPLAGMNFREADLSHAVFSGADLRASIIVSATKGPAVAARD